MEDRSPCLGCEKVVQLYSFSIRPDVSVDLWEGFLHPSLWEAKVVVLAELE